MDEVDVLLLEASFGDRNPSSSSSRRVGVTNSTDRDDILNKIRNKPTNNNNGKSSWTLLQQKKKKEAEGLFLQAECYMAEDALLYEHVGIVNVSGDPSNRQKGDSTAVEDKIKLMEDIDNNAMKVTHGKPLFISCVRYFNATGCFGMILVATIIGSIAFPLLKSRQAADANQYLLPTLSPTGSHYLELFDLLSEVLGDQVLSNQDTSNFTSTTTSNENADSSVSSPQRLALQWIANHDEAKIVPEDPRLLQRSVSYWSKPVRP